VGSSCLNKFFLKAFAGGFCKMPDFAWGDWAVGQVERVWDLMDITVLRAAKNGVDPSYKTSVFGIFLLS
jgi:hypothetical protein